MTLNPLSFADEHKVPQTGDAICLRSGVEQRLIYRSFNLKLHCFLFIQQGFQGLYFFDQLLDLESHSFSDDICLGLIRRGRIYRRGENRHTERLM